LSANVLRHFDAIPAIQLKLEVLSWGSNFFKERGIEAFGKGFCVEGNGGGLRSGSWVNAC